MPKLQLLHSQLKHFLGVIVSAVTPNYTSNSRQKKTSSHEKHLQLEETVTTTKDTKQKAERQDEGVDMTDANANSNSNSNSHTSEDSNDHLVRSSDANHPANLIPELCRRFYNWGWVTGTGGGISIRQGDHIFIAPSGVQKELMESDNIFVLSYPTPKYPPSARKYIRKPLELKPSACTPLFLAAFDREAAACIHTHSQWAVLVTLLVEREKGKDGCFEISHIEQIKGIPRGRGKGMLGYHDTLKIPIIENTAFEEDLTGSLEKAMDEYPDTYAVLVRRHGIYVWGDTVAKAKTQCESLDYLFQLAVEMHRLGLSWT